MNENRQHSEMSEMMVGQQHENEVHCWVSQTVSLKHSTSHSFRFMMYQCKVSLLAGLAAMTGDTGVTAE